jgi:hypothetical protein
MPPRDSLPESYPSVSRFFFFFFFFFSSLAALFSSQGEKREGGELGATQRPRKCLPCHSKAIGLCSSLNSRIAACAHRHSCIPVGRPRPSPAASATLLAPPEPASSLPTPQAEPARAGGHCSAPGAAALLSPPLAASSPPQPSAARQQRHSPTALPRGKLPPCTSRARRGSAASS